MYELRPFQEKGVAKIVNVCKGRGLLWVPMGLGKTPMAAKASVCLNCRRIVVLVRESGVPVWTRHTTDPEKLLGWDWLEKFSGCKVVVHNMDKLSKDERATEWNLVTPKDEIHVWVSIYNSFALDMGVMNRKMKKARQKGKVAPLKQALSKIIKTSTRFDILIADECKRISNRDSAAAIAIEHLLYNHNVPYFIPMSGTPGDKGPQSFWTYWRCIDRKKFASYWAYIEHFHTTMPSIFGEGREIVEQRLDTKPEWDRLLDRYAYVVTEAEVAHERPSLERQKVYTTLLPDQKDLYDKIMNDMLAVIGNDVVFAQNSMVQMLRLRQILICPKMLGEGFSCGGAIKTFADILEEESDDNRHTVIFTPFTKAFPHFTDYLQGRGFKSINHLQGSISANQLHERIESFRRDRGIIICSTQYAEAFSLEPATKAWCIGFDYSPDVNSQAEKRLHRLTSPAPVMINYFTYGTPTDERMTDIIAVKQQRIDLTIPDNIRKLLRGQL